jgi:type VI secretion system ImpC/EvpB family protein/type VI secretion system ImpB/VipA family protein
MPDSTVPGGMSFDFSIRPAGAAQSRDDEAPFRIAVLGEFSGNIVRDYFAADRRFRVDCDNLDQIFARLAVRLRLPAYTEASGALELRFQSLADLHPDRLVKQVEPHLVQLRDRLIDPTSAEGAAAELLELLKPVEEANAPAPSGSSETNEELLARLLAGSASHQRSAAPVASTVHDLLKQIVGPDAIPSLSQQQIQLLPLVDAELSSRLRRILHHLDFQALEAAWRGLDFLVRGIGEDIELDLINISKSELVQQLGIDDLAKTAIYRQLVELTPAAVLGIYTFGVQEHTLLAGIARLANACKTAFIGGASPDLVGCSSFGSQPDPDDWTETPEMAGLEALRRTPEAARLGLATPRFLLRQPYGKSSDPIDAFPFEEMAATPAHETYLWGNAGWLWGYLLADAFATEGWGMNLGGGEIGGLPVYKFAREGESVVTPCAEAWLTDKAADVILSHGIMPVLSIRGRDAVRLVAGWAVSNPPESLAVRR